LPWLVLLFVGAVVLWPQRTRRNPVVAKTPVAQVAPDKGERDGGSVSVGDSAPASLSVRGVIAVEIPPKPVPGQLRPDSNGRCRKGQFAINGGCWFKVEVDLSDCSGNASAYNGNCMSPL
jgi:serine/threonine-protein kinase